jgi:hypothetical protein
MRASGDVQSELVSQTLGQLVEQTPSQQISPAVVRQSDDEVQVVGHGSAVGFRQSPLTARCGSIFLTVVQQISPRLVLQSSLEEQLCGHSDGGKQNGLS